jgi:hypothetical protein
MIRLRPGQWRHALAADVEKIDGDFRSDFVREFAQWLRFWSQRLSLKGA